ncbi:response regulator transcription factor [Slackia heliotrinireducens]|uniref:response regulator transcription factor n=1 Tax=Slackia heliotrinireducens TaxID=84110 RepID=UPI0033160BCA
MTHASAIGVRPEHIAYTLGYSLTSVWATVVLLSPTLVQAQGTHVVTGSMLSGVVACLGLLLFRGKLPAFNGRTTFSALAATGMSVGTFLCTYPVVAAVGPMRSVGLVLSGFFAIILIMTWFDAFVRLSARAIVMLSGFALMASSVICFFVLGLPAEIESLVAVAAPLVSFALLPTFPRADGSGSTSDGVMRHDSTGSASFMRVTSEAITRRTLLGVVIVFFVIGSISVIAPDMDRFGTVMSPVYLVLPIGLGLFFIASSLVVKKRFDASLLYKCFLLVLAGGAFLIAYFGGVRSSLVFYSYIAADVLLWVVLALSAKSTPVAPFAVFAMGWLAECLGNVLGHNVAPFISDTPMFLGVVVLLIIVAVGFAFSDGLFVLDLDGGSMDSEEDAPGPAGGSGAETGEPQDAPVDAAGAQASFDARAAAFVEAHGLSRRESDVFKLWVTGHGLKYIQDTLFISESTVKTHMRSIYRKCDVHNREEIIGLFDREQMQ